MKTQAAFFTVHAFVFFAIMPFVIPNHALAISTPIQSTFDLDLDGWTDDVPGGSTAHASPGGNPGGYNQFTDTNAAGANIIAPNKFLGDWSNLNGVGTLSWDHKVFNFGRFVGSIGTLRAFISGPGGEATFDSGIVADTNWTSVTAPIIEGSWFVQTGTWSSLISNVSELKIASEMVNSLSGPSEITAIDNVLLAGGTQPIPEPSTMLLFGTGIVGLVAWRLRKSRVN